MDVDEASARFGLFIQASVSRGGNDVLGADLRLGFQINEHFGVFGSAGGLVGNESVGGTLVGLGARASEGPVFVEAQLDWYSYASGCYFAGPCESITRKLVRVGVGLEVMRFRHVGVEFRGEALLFGDGDGDRIVALGAMAFAYHL